MKNGTIFNWDPFSYYEQNGSYPSNISLYFHGSPIFTYLRNAIAIPDSNAFVTMYVSVILLEAARFPQGPTPSDDQLLAAIQALSSYHDKNQQVVNPILTFWPQVYNASSDTWVSNPINMIELVEAGQIVGELFEELLEDLGYDNLADDIAELVNAV